MGQVKAGWERNRVAAPNHIPHAVRAGFRKPPPDRWKDRPDSLFLGFQPLLA